MLPLVLGWLVLFGPIHIAFVEMIIDPVCALVFEAEAAEDNIMHRKPRAPDQPLFSLSMVWLSVVQGRLAFAMLAVAYLTATSLAMLQADDAVKAWRSIHVPITLAFGVSALGHIIAVFLFWGWT